MKLKTVDIKGKAYVQVHERIKLFRELPEFKGFRLITDIVERTEQEVFMVSYIYDNEGNLIANGHAHETKGIGMVNKTSHIENCETSAMGRALACLGIGIDDSYSSAEEVENAIEIQDYIKGLSDKTDVELVEMVILAGEKKTGKSFSSTQKENIAKSSRVALLAKLEELKLEGY